MRPPPWMRPSLARLMLLVALVAIAMAAVKLANDPLEGFHRRTGLPRPAAASVIATGNPYWGNGEYYCVFDAGRDAVEAWLSKRPAEGWRGWYRGDVPFWVTGLCSGARVAFVGHPVPPDSQAVVYCAFRVSPIDDRRGALVVIDETSSRVWFCSWGDW